MDNGDIGKIGQYARVLRNHGNFTTKWNGMIGRITKYSRYETPTLTCSEYALELPGEEWQVWFLEEHIEVLPDEEGQVLWTIQRLER